MLEIRNRTPFAARGTIKIDRDGRELWVVIVKGTFSTGTKELHILEEQASVNAADTYFGEPGNSSVEYPEELCLKPGTDVIVNGHVYAPGERALTRLSAGLQVGNRTKMLSVFGDREWSRISMSEPRPFISIPLRYERAFGGMHGAPENPIGTGCTSRAKSLAGTRLPNFEYPGEEILTRWDRPQMTGLGAVDRHWAPRSRHAGTYDDAWAKTRAPLWPPDFDERFFQAAHPDLIFDPPLLGGETIRLLHLHPARSILEFILPKVDLGLRTCIGRKWVHHKAQLATVVLEPDLDRICMSWQTSVSVPEDKFSLKCTEIREKRRVR